MAISTLMLRKYLEANGHLVQEGDESRAELIEACHWLFPHTMERCHRPEKGTPICVYIPDITKLVYRKPGPKRKVKDVTSDLV